MIKADAFASHLHLTCLSPSTVTQWDINSADFNRPGMQFCGFYEYFAFE
ncbi:MAG: HPr kinase/phosphorylase, partial [Clostridia bacterium]|nr:HPr kinase/phosphorylase [Clostridia bacterium]